MSIMTRDSTLQNGFRSASKSKATEPQKAEQLEEVTPTIETATG